MLRTLFSIFIATLCGISWGGEEQLVSGAIDSIHYDKSNNQIQINGWTWEEGEKKTAQYFDISVRGTPGKILREAPHNNAPSGNLENKKFSIIAKFDQPIKGGLAEINLSATFTGNQKLLLRTADGSPSFLHIPKIYDRHWILLAIIVLTSLLACTRRFHEIINCIDAWANFHTKNIAAGIFLIFILLVSTGITGSSLRIPLEGPFGQAAIEAKGSNSRIFKLRPDRGDEWGVLTPNVLAQIHHNPPFPITNTHLGLEGQNMGVIGMTGVPIAQWAAIARPATWGYFLLPLRQAQAWQWQLPFWGCLLALWWLLNLWKPNLAGRNLALSFLFCIAPYAAAWSNWPLYATFFPVMALAIFINLSKTKKLLHGIYWGVCLGYVITAWVLVLYPPWIVSIGTLCALLCAGWLLDHRSSLQLRKAQAVGFLTSLIIAAVLLGSWWYDTKEALSTLQNTVYPGQRTTLTGGDNSLLWALRGYTNLESVTFGTGPWTNQPEISSYIWFPVVIVWLCVWGLIREKRSRWLLFGCSFFIAFYSYFVFLGIPSWLAKITQWGRVPTNRGDISLGLAFIVLLCLTTREWFSKPTSKMAAWINGYFIFIALTGSLWLVYANLLAMPVFVFPKNSLVYIAAILVATFFCVWWLIKGKTAGPICLLTVLFLISSIGFNPVSKAPKSIELSPQIKAMASDESGHLLRTLVVGGEGIGPLTLAAVGIPIVNGVLYYPHRTLWQQLELPEKYWATVNRYQHLGFTTGMPKNGDSYSVASPAMDWVSVIINPDIFDFNRTSAKRVTALEDQAIHLRKSPMLREIGTHKGLVWFSVQPAP